MMPLACADLHANVASISEFDPPLPLTKRRAMTTHHFDDSTSKSLLSGLQNRDPQAWGQVAEIYAPLIQRWCHQQGAAAHEIDEIVQRVLLAVITSFADYRQKYPGRKFRKWLWKVTRSKLMDTYREQQRSEALPPAETLSDPASLAMQISESPPEDAQEYSDTIRRAMEVVRRTCQPETWQIFLRATRGEGTTASIADEYKTTPQNVRQIKARYLSRLRGILEMRDDSGIA